MRNYVTNHTNIDSLNCTDHGYFYFASALRRTGFKTMDSKGLFVVDIMTGEGHYYSSITSFFFCKKKAKDLNTAPRLKAEGYS